MTVRRCLCLLACATVLAACTASPVLVTPAGFVALPRASIYQPITYKAVSADDVVLMVRHIQDQPEGSVEFWAEAISRELIESRGYELLGNAELRCSAGLDGRLLSFRGALGKQLFRYELAVFVKQRDVITVEAAVPEPSYDRYAPVLKTALESLRFE